MTTSPTALRRVLLYSHDTFGLGHLRRNLAIAQRLLESRAGLQVVLMTGSPVAERFPMPRGLTVVGLPAVVKVGAERYRPRDERFDIDLVRRARSAVMVDAATRLRPDVFLVDHAPQGMKGELLPVFDALRRSSPATRIVLGLRDVLDDPMRVRATWADQDVYRTLASAFDRIVVYGSEDLFDVVEAYGLSEAVSSQVTYAGYICRPAKGQVPSATSATSAGYVLGTAGGGGDGIEVLSATLAASASLGVPSRVVTGPLMSATDRAALERQARRVGGATLVEFVDDLSDSIARAGAVVTMGGYNTLCELVSSGVPTVVVPRTHPRREQAIRAELFERRGAVSVVPAGAALESRLRAGVAAALAAGARRGPCRIDLGGLDRLDEVVEAEARSSREGAQRRVGSTPALEQVAVRL